MWQIFRVQHRAMGLAVVFFDGERVVVHDEDGKKAFDGSVWLFNKCWERGFFTRF